jgi:hypothetical protein
MFSLTKKQVLQPTKVFKNDLVHSSPSLKHSMSISSWNLNMWGHIYIGSIFFHIFSSFKRGWFRGVDDEVSELQAVCLATDQRGWEASPGRRGCENWEKCYWHNNLFTNYIMYIYIDIWIYIYVNIYIYMNHRYLNIQIYVYIHEYIDILIYRYMII